METRVVDRAIILLALTLLFEILKASILKGDRVRALIPLLSAGLGIAIMLSWAYVVDALQGEAILYSVLDGIIVGASASGLYEGSKAVGRALNGR